MQQLEERMLRVCARFAKHEFAYIVIQQSVVVDSMPLAVAFHFNLLDVSWETMQRLRIRNYDFGAERLNVVVEVI